jgi:hypothetical protein
MTNECKCCGRTTDIRMGYCYDCVECESVIDEGVDMYDKEILKLEGMSLSMSKLKYILDKYRVTKR